MTIWATGLLVATAALLPPARAIAVQRPDVAISQLLIRQRTIVRIPTQAPVTARITEWRARKGPKCVPMAGIAGAAVVAEDSVDLLIRGGQRVRAEFEDGCADLDYYAGFYLRPGADGRVCADRDSIHVRSGGECRIERFRALEPRAAGRTRGNGVLDRIRRRLGR